MEITKRGRGNPEDIKIAKYINVNRWAEWYLLELSKDIAKAHEGKLTSETFSRAKSKQPFKPNLGHQLS